MYSVICDDDRTAYKIGKNGQQNEQNQKDDYELPLTPRLELPEESKPNQNTAAVEVWGKAKRLYQPMNSPHLDRFDVHQDKTKKDYQDDVITRRVRSASSLMKMFHFAKHNLQYSVAQGACTLDRSLEAVDSKTRFGLVFPEINVDQYQGAYRCRLIIPGDTHVYSGQFFVCTDFVCFYVETIDNLFESMVPLKITCPFVYVQRILKAAKIIRGAAVEVVPMTPDEKPSVIQLWTSDNQVHQFTAFGANFDSVFFKMTNLYRLHTLV